MPRRTVNGIDLHYTDAGEPERDAVLLIHGLGSSSGDWEYQLPVLTASYRVIAVDLRGHGSSSKPPGPYSITMFADDVAALIEDLDIGPCHVVGLSLGAMTALELAATRPDLVRSAVVVNSGADFIPKTLKDRALVWQRLALVRTVGIEKVARLVADRTLPGDEHAELRNRVIESLAANDKAAYLASMKAIVGWSVHDRLDRITSPVLVVASELDYSSVESKQQIVDQAQDARMVVVKGARHLLPVEKPDEFNKILVDWLGER
ncbi:MAG: alpha/beta hydrolase [Acidimicrobiia bacterium]|nr:MAG: alpha/beta hydrolase [Acidimicrobiia bacterium]